MRILIGGLLALLMTHLFGEEPLWPTPGTWGTIYFGYQNEKKEWVIPPRFTQAKPFSDGAAPVKEDGHWKIIDRAGKILVTFSETAPITDIGQFSEGVAVMDVGLQGNSRFVDRDGKAVGEVVTYAGFFSEGLGAFSNFASTRDTALWGYLDRSGNVVIPPRFKFAGPFVDGQAGVVFEDGSVWYIGKNGAGKTRIEGVDLVGPIRNGLAVAHALGTASWGYVDASGVQAIPFQYLEARSFFDGLAAVKVPGNRGWGYIDRSGKTVISNQFDAADAFQDGRAWVSLKGDRCAIDKSGKVVWSMKAEIPLNMKSPEDYKAKRVIPAEPQVVSGSPLGNPESFLERIQSMKSATPTSSTVGNLQVREYKYMRNRLRLYLANDKVTRIEIIALVRRAEDAKNIKRMRYEPGSGFTPEKGPGTDIEAEQASALELITSSLAVAAQTADETGIRKWVTELWQPASTIAKTINGRQIFARTANFNPVDAMGTDKEGQLIIVTCDANPSAGFASPGTLLPLWVIGPWAERATAAISTSFNISDDHVETDVPARATVDGQEQITTETIDAAFEISDSQVVFCTSQATDKARSERNFVVGTMRPNAIYVGAPSGHSYERVRVRVGIKYKQVDGQLKADSVYRGFPAYNAGLRPGDMILSINGAPVTTVQDALAPFADKTKSTFDVQLNRGGKVLNVTITVPIPNP